MFLDVTKRRNPQLIKVATQLHQAGEILPDTYVLDLDTIVENAKILKKNADKVGIELFYMTKQLGRNPLVAEKIRAAGIDAAVVVDYKEALVMMEHGLPIGNVGHLVQVPKQLLKKMVAYRPQFMTVFSIESIEQINEIAKELKVKQKLLIKMIETADEVYEGQFGGFHLADLPELAKKCQELSHIELAGITSFPCFLFNGVDELTLTHNVQTIQKARELLQAEGIVINEVNIPSATCSKTLPMIKQINGTQGEPGHALTGTTPLHAKMDLEELPAMVYVSEISHNLDGKGYFYGGGYYRRGHLEQILVMDQADESQDEVVPFGNDSIDYYLTSQQAHPVGATVIAAFRTQIFVTRSDVAVVSGIKTGQPKIEGIYNSQGNLIRR
ncbi:alanine racemase [uncultured Vagococcus sp.]|uniref:alanine racemase n=1 Tax=uncultured Vagococcus sp. TaxID=189676 RepID=UPI0028D7DE40|nr:alanine racemase [uncultured Vagococcus sp.]